MSLWKLRVGAEAYYLAQVASGLDDYYSGQGESVGRWVGNAATALGLDGEVSGEDLRAVLAGLEPGTALTPNGVQVRPHPRRVPGFDLTFSVPKSVSVAYALGDPLVQGAVVEAGEAAVAETLAWLEREACHVRRGTNNRHAKVPDVEMWGTRRLPGAGFVAAQFRHRTSRAGDPQLHWHVLVANTTQGPDRRWSALDGTGLYRSKRTAGVVFQAALRRELTERLGVEWTPPVKDSCEIAGIPRKIIRLFSKRRDEIEAELERLGTSGPKAAEEATLATRKTKGAVDAEGIVPRWQQEAETAGWGQAELDTLLASVPHDGVVEEMDVDRLVALVGDRLISSDSTFTRHEVTQAVAASLPAGGATTEVDRLTAGVLAHPEIVAIHDPAELARPTGWEQRFTTRRLIALETEIADTIASGVASHTGALAPEAVAVACAVASLGTDQHDVVTRLCAQGNAIEVLVGRAGTGKTYTLAAVAAAYRVAGWATIGVAPSARAARELETGAAIASFTVPRFDHHRNDHPLTASTVVVVDEAGMCGTVDLHHVITTARQAGAKVILVGDHHQLPEVQAGGGLANAIATLGDQVCELTINRRQVESWEVDALDHLRHGDVADAWDAFLTHDRVRILDDPVELHQLAVDDWWTAHTTGSDALLLAGTRSEAYALNRLARDRATGEHLLTGPALTVAGRTFQAGDRVLICRNDTNQTTPNGQRIRIDNGMLGTVNTTDPEAGTLDVRLRTGEIVRLDHDYLADGHLDHGYAMTIHKSQGATCDAVFVVGPAGLYREAAYVALSRARHGATLYATSRQAAEIGERDHATGLPLPSDTDHPEHDLLATIGRSEAKAFATTTDPTAAAVADLAELPLDVLRDRLIRAATAEARAAASGLADPADDLAALERARHARRHLVPDRRVRALDRDNVGTIISLHDTTGDATVLFVADDGTPAVRTLAWRDLKPIDHPEPVDLTPDAQQWLDREAHRIVQSAELWATALADYSIEPGEAGLLQRAIQTRRELLARQMHADSPDWLTWWVGTRPIDTGGATVWDDTVSTIAAWRDLHHVTAEQPGFGVAPTEPKEREQWLGAMATTLAQRSWLSGRDAHPAQVSGSTLTPVEIHDRISQLDQIFAGAPTDHSRIIDDLIAGHLTTPDLHAALTEARSAQTERDRWIVANWPHIVEHHELHRLADQHDALAHWPTPIRPTVEALLNRLAAQLDPDLQVEDRTLGELHAAIAALDPGARLRDLTQQLVAVNDRLHQVETDRSAATNPDRSALFVAELETLRSNQNVVRTMIATERQTLSRRTLAPTDHDELRAAIAHRTATIYQQAISERPDWLIEVLNGLDDRGTLEQLRLSQVRELVLGKVTAADHAVGAPIHSAKRQVERTPARAM
ncbi:MAG TPA: MobF family relaxase [Ilumatobacteraceae bacterium]|nr:MobF family relaxase [Ilumatobacteraceae bacterium]